MNREPLVKLHASQAIEDLLVDSNDSHSQQNWLLSYLDVFVLIVMLVITLLAMTDITAQKPKQSKKLLVKKQKQSQGINPTKINDLKTIRIATEAEQLIKPILQNNVQPETEHHLIPNSQVIEKKEPVAELNEPDKTTEIQKEKTLRIDEVNSSEPSLNDKKTSLEKAVKPEKLWQEQLKNKIDNLDLSNSVNLKIKEGFAQIEIQDNILFDSAKAELTEEGKSLLVDLALLLKQSAGLIFIEGHTDNRPIATERFPSNWELGSARATSVLHYLTSQGLNNQRLRAVTYADTMPLEDNSTETGRQRNRRVNLLVKIPDS